MSTPTPLRYKLSSLLTLGTLVQAGLVAILILLFIFTVPVNVDAQGQLSVQLSYIVGAVGLISLAIIAGGVIWGLHRARRTAKLWKGGVIAFPAIAVGFAGLLTLIGLQIGADDFNVGNLFWGLLGAIVLGANLGWLPFMLVMSRLPVKSTT